jgi:hypothetical protein
VATIAAPDAPNPALAAQAAILAVFHCTFMDK